MPNSATPKPPAYALILAIVILLAVVLIGIVLWLRPLYDPLLIITAVGTLMGSIGSGVMVYTKSQETHVAVNSRVDEWIATQTKNQALVSHAQGVSDEQARAASLPPTQT